MSHQPSTIRRIWLTITPCLTPGKIGLRLSPVPPVDMKNCMAVLMTRGDVPVGWPVELEVVSDPSADPALKGKTGDAATVKVGKVAAGAVGSVPVITNSGTTSAAIFDFTLPAPRDGIDGLSAYQVARAEGYGGTQAQWLASLIGAAGKSAYQLARDAGYGGTETQWLASLKAADGVSPVISIGTITTLPAGSQATATITGTAAAPKLNIGIPIGATGAPGSTMIGSITLAESNLVSVSAGVRRRVIATTFDLPLNVPLFLLPKAPPPVGYIVQAAWAMKVRELTVDLTLPAITALTSYSFDNWLLRTNT
jgi:hypothetical protein